MTTYRVPIEVTVSTTYDVTAPNEDEARRFAWRMARQQQRRAGFDSLHVNVGQPEER